ncbi:MAG: YidC/Oxa1 family membrane protein insertase [Chloroflexota bacterium]
MEFLGIIWNSLWHLLLNVLVAINSVVHVPGIAIIIFTIFVRMLTVPLTMKSLKSNRNMQQIQPLIKEVQKKYKDDKAKQQEETMKLYQQYGINPAAGCLPMVVQLPIFFGLFSALQFTLQHGTDVTQMSQILWNKDWATAGFANFAAPFGWVPSLASHDPLYIWPVISGLFQFLQNRMSLPRRDPNSPQDTQQKMMNGMMQFMPLYIIFISLSFPAGTVIYWAFSSLFGAVQQYFITGFGSLPDFPGFGWLPRKTIIPPKLPDPLPEGTVRKKGVMGKMMERAMEAQEAQKATQEQSRAEVPSQATTPLSNGTRPERPRDGASTTRVRSKASEQHIHVVSGSAPKYASDARKSTNEAANGSGYSNGKASALPPKKRSKK